jgi:hypothetical protein
MRGDYQRLNKKCNDKIEQFQKPLKGLKQLKIAG